MAYQPKSYRKFIVGAVSTAVVASSFAGVAGAASFTDVNSKYQEAVDFVVSKGVKGFANEFGTYQNIKRVDAAVFIAQVKGLDTVNAPASGFTDVPARAAGAVNALKAAGITSGKSATTFGAQDYITRGELAVWIQKAFGLEAGYQNLAFTDVPSQYANAVNALVSNKVTSGISATLFGTYENAKRGDFAVFLYKASKAKDDVKPTPITPTILKMDGDSKGNKLANGEKKTYTVTLTNPVSGKPVEGADINITFEENVGTDFGPQRNVTVTNPKTGHSVIPYQANDGTERTLVVTTDKDGKATFTVTGDNATVTPIAFLDGSNQKFDTKGGIEFTTKDDRFDKNVEYYVKGTAVTFGVTEYKIALEGKRTNYAAINFGQKLNGREYVITVTKPDGTAYAGGVVNVGVLEDLDDVLGNNTKGAFITAKDGKDEISTIKLDSKGQATIVLASTAVNDSARPFVWIDQNEGTNPQGDGKYEKGEPVSNSNVAPTNFQPERVDNGTLGAELKIADGAAEYSKDVTLKLLNQSGKPFTSERFDKDARVTFQVKNTGVNDLEVLNENGVSLGVVNEGGTKTFAVTISNDTKITLRVKAAGAATSGNSSAEVTVDGVVKWYEQSESQSVAVEAGPVKVNLGDSYNAVVTADGQDTNDNSKDDRVVLTFDKEVFNFEAGDFRLDGDATKVANSVTKDGKKLILTFSEDELSGATNVTYDASFSGDKALANDLGDKVLPFSVEIK